MDFSDARLCLAIGKYDTVGETDLGCGLALDYHLVSYFPGPTAVLGFFHR
jgi:hypothetical protein